MRLHNGAISNGVYRMKNDLGRLDSAAHSGAFGQGSKRCPTAEQIRAGNYAKGHLWAFGLPLVIETPMYQPRCGKADGKPFATVQQAHYGYIRGTKGADGDAVDCFIGPALDSELVFVVNQHNKAGEFDEHKVMLGFLDVESARMAYLGSYEQGWTGLGSIVPASLRAFKRWLKTGASKKTPFQALEGDDVEEVKWTEGARLIGADLADLMFRLRAEDAGEGAMLDSMTMADIDEAHGAMMLDAMVMEYRVAPRKIEQLRKVMANAGQSVKCETAELSKPFKSRGTTQVAALFQMTDGQTVTVFFHNPDSTPNKLRPDDELVSWKWMLNKKDVTIIVAPERGQDINPREVGRRIMKLVEKNSEKFQKANAAKAEELAEVEGLKGEVEQKTARIAALDAEIERLEQMAADNAGLVPPAADPAPEPTPAPAGGLNVDDVKAVMTESVVMDAPAGWIVMNAPRPLAGHKSLEGGPFLTGRFYAAIDPAELNAAGLIDANRKLDAAIVMQGVDRATQMAMALVGSKYRDEYMEMPEAERSEALDAQIKKLYGKPYGELKALMAQAKAGQAPAGGAVPEADALSPEVLALIQQVAEATGDTPENLTRLYRLSARRQGVEAATQWLRDTLAQNSQETTPQAASERERMNRDYEAGIRPELLENFEGLGPVVIQSIGSENLYFRKGDKPYYTKMFDPDIFAGMEGTEVDLNDYLPGAGASGPREGDGNTGRQNAALLDDENAMAGVALLRLMSRGPVTTEQVKQIDAFYAGAEGMAKLRGIQADHGDKSISDLMDILLAQALPEAAAGAVPGELNGADRKWAERVVENADYMPWTDVHKARQMLGIPVVTEESELVKTPEGRAELARRIAAQSAGAGAADPEDEDAGGTIEADGRENPVRTAKGTKLVTGFRVIEGKRLIVSHDRDGNPNPEYPQELQPRDRARQTSQAWIQKTAKSLDPDSLGRTQRADSGAPIVGPDRVVESGNGRTLAILEAYRIGAADEYREWLIQEADYFGISADKVRSMKQPVLVRVRKTAVDRAAFAVEANQDDKLAMTATEKARSDARRLTPALLARLEDGDLTSAANRDFLAAFLQSLGDAEAAQYLTTDGKPTGSLIARVQAALFAGAYADDRLLELTADVAKPEIANIVSALNQAAPDFIRAASVDRVGTEQAGERLTDSLELSLNQQTVSAILAATGVLAKAKESGMSIEEFLKQGDMFGGTDPAVAAMAVFIHRNNRSARRMGTAFKAMAKFVEAENERKQSAGLFGDDPVRFEDVVAAANRELEKEFGEGVYAIEQSDLFAQPQPAPAPEPEPAAVDEQLEADKRYLDSIIDGTADLAAGDVLERMEAIYERHGEGALQTLFADAAEAFSQHAVKLAQKALG